MADALKKVLQRNLLAALRKRSFEDADRLLQALRDEDPLSVETRGLELEYLIYRKWFAEAEPLAKQLVHLFPSSPRIHYLAGRLAYAQRRYPEAEVHFRESGRLYPQWFTQLFLGKTLTQKGDFDEAESILNTLAREHVGARRDLSWLYERRGDYRRALREIETVLTADPEDQFAHDQQRRLQGLCLAPDEVVHEMDTLRELGETIEENLLPPYVESLLRTGKGDRAREVISDTLDHVSPHIIVRIAWNCYRLQAFDLSYQLFARSVGRQPNNVKMLSALETSARRCGRLDQLVKLYQEQAVADPRLYGRLRKLSSAP